MSKIPDTLEKHAELSPAADYYRLRREGIGFIAQLASDTWTDYNAHDPGITLLESLCYAITDVAYRSQWPIADLLTPATPPANAVQPYPDQAFFTAREILTVNPVTPDDFRRLLIDLDAVRNAWVFSQSCSCDFDYYAWCDKKHQLQLGYKAPQTGQQTPVKVAGLYDVLLELEADPELGDLNDRKITASYQVFDSEGRPHATLVELRFPYWQTLQPEQQAPFFSDTPLSALTVTRLGANKSYDVLSDNTKETDLEKDKYLRDHWRQVFYVSFTIDFSGNQQLVIEHAALRMFGDTASRNLASLAQLTNILEDTRASGLLQRYRHKLKVARQAVNDAKQALHQHRNLGEDYCHVKVVDIEDVAACADVNVRPDADIERVQARIWFAIEQYCNPPLEFYSLQERLADNAPVEDIFNGPALSNGFIGNETLAASQLRTVLRTSDIISHLMDIDGIISVNNLLLAKYDAEGNPVTGASDPGYGTDNSNRLSASWQLLITPQHQPRFHRHLSSFVFFKDGLPLRPRADEALATLIQLRGEQNRPKVRPQTADSEDLAAPAGVFRDPLDYYPLQYGLPPAYGVGAEGLPTHASEPRQAQAKQLKAYLLVFEQIIANALAQIGQCAELFSLDPAVQRSYFVKCLNEEIIKGYNDVTDGLNLDALEKMTETEEEFQQRRNRFLDHLMARFGEQFSEYALLLTRRQELPFAQRRLIEDKLTFLKAYPAVSSNRYRAFDYKMPGMQGNAAGLKKRVALLLGFPDLAFAWTQTEPDAAGYAIAYQLKDTYRIWFEGNVKLEADTPEAAQQLAYASLLTAFSKADAYLIEPAGADSLEYPLLLQDADGQPLGQSADLFASKSQAEAFKDELLGWSADQRAVIVEHLLLRPKFPGDALYPACSSDGCAACGDEDPYSFRLTWMMPGWTAPYNNDLEMRGFADRTIRKEMPAHLLAKICWVANDGFSRDEALIQSLSAWLITKTVAPDDKVLTRQQADNCALAIYTLFDQAFTDWYQNNATTFFQPDVLNNKLQTLFSPLTTDGLGCAAQLGSAQWAEIKVSMAKYFQQRVIDGWQFERFQQAWQQWLDVNRRFDWSEERLSEQVRAILKAGRLDGPVADLCSCSASILGSYGEYFHQWLNGKMLNRVIPQPWNAQDFADFTPLALYLPALCSGLTFKPGTAEKLQQLLDNRYAGYREVSHALHQVVTLLAALDNTYPQATLHDYDDGSDQNPVRLGSTALGSQHT